MHFQNNNNTKNNSIQNQYRKVERTQNKIKKKQKQKILSIATERNV